MLASVLGELQARKTAAKTVYGFYEPTGEYGGRLVRCIQDQDGEWVEVDAEPDVSLPAKLEPAVRTTARFVVLFGGRGGAKSEGVGAIHMARAKDYGFKVMCLRENQNTIEDSVHALLKKKIQDANWAGFDITDNAIRRNGDDIAKFRGMARNIDGVKSAFGFNSSWVEEAQTASAKSLSALTPTLREAGSQCWFTFNPGSSADPCSERFLEPFYTELQRNGVYEDDLHCVIWINYSDNPWHRELESERLFDRTNLSENEYRHKWEGHYNDEIENALIPAAHFDAAIDAHKKLGFQPTGAKIAAHDPSDEGPDDKGYALRHGSVVLKVLSKPDGDVNEGCDWALGEAVNDGADVFTWDGDGMGVALKRNVDQALDGKAMDYVMFRGSESPENPDQQYVPEGRTDADNLKTNRQTFYNRRAQYYTLLRDRFAATYRAVEKGEYVNPNEMISLAGDIEGLSQLRAEVCRIPTKPNNNGKIQILSKPEMAKKPYELPSPNLADALMMSMVTPPRSKQGPAKKISFTGWGT